MKKQILMTESYSPLDKQLMQKIRSDIAAGVYPVHSRIPSEQELCDTVNADLQKLANDGTVAELAEKYEIADMVILEAE